MPSGGHIDASDMLEQTDDLLPNLYDLRHGTLFGHSAAIDAVPIRRKAD